MKNLLVTLLMSLFLLNNYAWAQGGGDAQLFEDGTQDLIIVLASGAFGAVLGLSTLSFVDHPERHLKSIVVGGAIGIIFGVATVAYIQADKSKQMYLGQLQLTNEFQNFNTYARNDWHSDFVPSKKIDETTTFIQHTFTF